jgi:hypothetical protein
MRLNALGSAAVMSAALAVQAAYADTLTRSIQDVTVISDGTGGSRVLFDLASIGDLGNVAISRATLTFTLSGSAGEGRTTLRLHPVTASWSSGGASWTSWSSPGGDYDEAVYTRTELDLSRSGTVSIDATSLLKEIVEGGMTTHGFIIIVEPGDGDVPSSNVVDRLQNLGSATLELKYRKVPPKPRGA